MINDMINPMELDLTKNLHGHVRVELRDRWTGRVVDSQEKDNLVTTATQKAYMFGRWISPGNNGANATSRSNPLYATLLGGIMLFGGTLTESASNIYFPASAKLVGYAGQFDSTANTFLGSYNATESTALTNGFTSVWDFGTSQANGTIAALARTSHNFANNPIAAEDFRSSYGAQNVIIAHWIGYDSTTGNVYLTPRSQTTLNGTTYYISSIYKAKVNIFAVGLIGAYPPAEKWTLVKNLTSSDGSTTAYNFVYDKYDNNFVYASGTTLHVVAMDGTHTTKTLTGTSGSIAVTENYYWRFTGTTVYRIQKSNVSNITTFTFSATAIVRPYENDIVFVSPDSGTWATIIYPDGTTIDITGLSSYWVYAPTRYIDLCYSYTPISGTQVYETLAITPNYLGTIANLDSPVTKTSSQTMKITYTLTEA